MAAKEYIVQHKSLYLRVEGKLQEMPVGTKVKLEPKQAEKMLAKGMIFDPKEVKTVEPKAEEKK
jgi:predicted transcriptional regulator